jgi:hypothetical protein
MMQNIIQFQDIKIIDEIKIRWSSGFEVPDQHSQCSLQDYSALHESFILIESTFEFTHI